MARLLGASFATLLIAAIAAVSFAYPALFPEPLERPDYVIDAGEAKAALDSTVTLEVRGSLSEEDVLEAIAVEPHPLEWPPEIQVEHIARLPWHEGFDWAKTRLTINPSAHQMFEPGTSYGFSIDGQRVLAFETITLPRVVGAHATEIDPEGSGHYTTASAVVFSFSEPVKWDDRFLQVTPPASVSVHAVPAASGRTEVWVTPTHKWENQKTYTLTISDGVQDRFGHASVEAFTHAFTTWPAPSLLASGPTAESEPPDTSVFVQFERDADRRSVEESFRIEPAAAGTFEWVNERTLSWKPDGLEYSTRYAVSLAGNAVGGDAFPSASWSFETQDPPISIDVAGSLQAPTILTASFSGGIGEYDFEWSDGEKASRRLAVAPAGQTGELGITVRSGDQTANATVQLKGPAVDTGHTPVPCPAGWEMIDISVCYRSETLPGPAKVYITRIDIKDPAIDLRSQPAAAALGQAATVGQAARAHGAIAAVNGDFFGLAQASYYPMGPIVSDGQIIYSPPSNVPVLAIDPAGNPWSGSAIEFQSHVPPADFAVGGSHILLRNGAVLPVDNQHGGLNPRTALGLDGAGFAYLVTVDGRAWHSIGMTLPTLQRYLHNLGVLNAINLDGGGSSTMAIRGTVVNVPSDGRERPVATVVEVLRR